MTIVTYAHRRKPSPRRRQTMALAMPVTVTARKRGKRPAGLPDMTPDEYQQRGDAAEALWRELVRRSAGDVPHA